MSTANSADRNALVIGGSIGGLEADVFCEAGVFWVRPDGRLYMADVTNMPWARPDLEFLQSKIPFAVENTFAVENRYPARRGH